MEPLVQTHEDPEARRRFEIVDQVLGWGNPRARIWFIGLEEAGQWDEDSNKDKKGYERCSKCVNGWLPVLEGEIEKQAEKDGKNYTKIYEIMSKLVLEVTGGKLGDWSAYHIKQLFMDEIACQTNLYPLGKKNYKKELPEYYKTLFGFGPKEGEQYREIVRRERLPRLRESWKQAKPAVTVCFGDAQEEFRELFGDLLGVKEDEFKINKCNCKLYSSGIVITPFFARYLMPNKCIEGLAERLRPLWKQCIPHSG